MIDGNFHACAVASEMAKIFLFGFAACIVFVVGVIAVIAAFAFL